MEASINTPIVLGVGTVLATIIGSLIYKKLRKEKIPLEWERVGYVKELCLYPLKSGRPNMIEKAFCNNQGFIEVEKQGNTIKLKDRSFLIYSTKNMEARTGREIPKCLTIAIQAAENGVILSAPGKNDLYISIPKIKKDIKVAFRKETFVCTDCGDTVAKWLSTYLLGKDEGLRLGYGDGSSSRDIIKANAKWAEYYKDMDNNLSGIYSNLGAMLVVNQATVDDLNEKLPADQEKASYLNFRPSILVEGPKAFAEDNWKYVRVGEVVSKVGLECLRCLETTVDQNGIMNKQREPLKTLETYRKNSTFKQGIMGIYLIPIQTGNISKGDGVYVSK